MYPDRELQPFIDRVPHLLLHNNKLRKRLPRKMNSLPSTLRSRTVLSLSCWFDVWLCGWCCPWRTASIGEARHVVVFACFCVLVGGLLRLFVACTLLFVRIGGMSIKCACVCACVFTDCALCCCFSCLSFIVSAL